MCKGGQAEGRGELPAAECTHGQSALHRCLAHPHSPILMCARTRQAVVHAAVAIRRLAGGLAAVGAGLARIVAGGVLVGVAAARRARPHAPHLLWAGARWAHATAIGAHKAAQARDGAGAVAADGRAAARRRGALAALRAARPCVLVRLAHAAAQMRVARALGLWLGGHCRLSLLLLLMLLQRPACWHSSGVTSAAGHQHFIVLPTIAVLEAAAAAQAAPPTTAAGCSTCPLTCASR